MFHLISDKTHLFHLFSLTFFRIMPPFTENNKKAIPLSEWLKVTLCIDFKLLIHLKASSRFSDLLRNLVPLRRHSAYH